MAMGRLAKRNRMQGRKSLFTDKYALFTHGLDGVNSQNEPPKTKKCHKYRKVRKEKTS